MSGDRDKRKRGASDKATPNDVRQKISYGKCLKISSIIDGILAGLLCGLQYPHLTSPERATVLDTIDALLRLKADLGLLKGVRRAS